MFRLPLHCLTFFLLTIALAAAETVVLKSGEKLEGKILEETDAAVRIETSAGGIIDERTIAKTDIERVEKVQGDETAWQTLKNYQPGANSLPVLQYERVITPLNAFITQYPQSAHAADAKKALAAFEEERKRVEAGEMKIDGKWLTKEEVEKDRYQINARLAFNYMRMEQANNRFIEALNAFDVLERDYPGAAVYPDAAASALQILQPLAKQAALVVAALPQQLEDQQKRIDAALEPSKSDMKAAFEREKATSDAMLDAARKQNLKWPPYLPRNLDAMKQILDKANSDLSRLADLDVAKMRNSIALSEQAKKAIADKDIEAAEGALSQARDAWSANYMLAQIDTDLNEARTVAAAEAAAAEQPVELDKTKTVVEEATEDATLPDPADAEEEASGIRPMHIVLGIVVIAFCVIGLKTYKSIKAKASDVLE